MFTLKQIRIEDFKKLVAEKFSVPASEQRILARGRVLSDDKLLKYAFVEIILH